MKVPRGKLADLGGITWGGGSGRRQGMHPGVNPRTSSKFTVEQMAFLRRHAHQNRMTVSGVIRKAVAEYMARCVSPSSTGL